MSAQHTPGRTGGTARLWPVCPASRDKFTSYASKDRPDAEGRVPCPACCKVVKLGPANGVIGTRIVIPHHHAQPNEANLARIRERSSNPWPLREAIKLCDAAVKWAEGGGKVGTEELRAIRAAIAKATS